MGRRIVFALFLIIIVIIIIIISLSAQILSGRVFSNHWADFSEIWGYYRYGYEVVQESFKMQNGGL